MKHETVYENPLKDSKNYTFVSTETLRNTFPVTVQQEGVNYQCTMADVSAPQKDDYRISEPES